MCLYYLYCIDSFDSDLNVHVFVVDNIMAFSFIFVSRLVLLRSICLMNRYLSTGFRMIIIIVITRLIYLLFLAVTQTIASSFCVLFSGAKVLNCMKFRYLKSTFSVYSSVLKF